jgi:hypothetical protein
MKIEWQNKLKRFLEHVESVKEDELYGSDAINDLISSAQAEKINLRKDQLSVETGERFIRFTDSDIPAGLIIPLNGKMFEYAIYQVPLEGNVEAAQRLLEDLGSPKYQSVSDNKLKIVMYYNDKIHDNPAIEERMKLIAERTINRFEMACIDYNNEAETYNKMIESELKNKIESKEEKRTK